MRDLNSHALDDPLRLVHLYEWVIEQLRSASEAVRHPLGFVILSQEPTPDGGYSRVHIWRRDPATAPVPHRHGSLLRSLVMAGCLKNTIWTAADPTPADRALFEIRKVSEDARDYHAVGERRLIEVASREFGPGERYEVSAEEFHSTECRSDFCVTLVHRSPHSALASQCALPLANSEPAVRVRFAPRGAEFEAAAQILRDELSAMRARELV